jgi:drug/metabolite transporter (DMT)-like permease
LTPHLGELAALFTSLSFSATSTFFTLAGRRVGAVVVNRSRLVLAVTFLTITHWALLGTPAPLTAAPFRWIWLSLSGVIGLVLGDALLFQAFIWIGPRLSMLMMSFAPILAALLGWLFLKENLTSGQVAGMLLTLGGVAWVVLERGEIARDQSSLTDRNYLLGILFGLGGATGQATGLITAKLGSGGDFSPISGTLIRMLAAAATMWTFTLFRRQGGETLSRLRQKPEAGLFILGGAFTGPFLGVTSSLLSIQLTEVGVASTLMALPPVFLLPIGALVFQERVTGRAVLGTFLAVMGVGLLFLV